MSNSADAARKITEPGAHEAVRRVLDAVPTQTWMLPTLRALAANK